MSTALARWCGDSAKHLVGFCGAAVSGSHYGYCSYHHCHCHDRYSDGCDDSSLYLLFPFPNRSGIVSLSGDLFIDSCLSPLALVLLLQDDEGQRSGNFVSIRFLSPGVLRPQSVLWVVSSAPRVLSISSAVLLLRIALRSLCHCFSVSEPPCYFPQDISTHGGKTEGKITSDV